MNAYWKEKTVRQWLDEVWAHTERLEVLEGGEDVPLARRRTLVSVGDRELLRHIRALTTSGEFSGDICRCPGDLTIALFDARDAIIGLATLHPGMVSWERQRFRNDLIVSDAIALRLVLSQIGVNGASRAVLDRMIEILGLHEGDVQFRPAYDPEALMANRVPSALAEQLRQWSGEESANLDQEVVMRLTNHLIQAEGDSNRAVAQLLAWLGSATWPAEAMAGDGQLARRMLGEIDPLVIVDSLPNLVDPIEVMGAVVWAAFRSDDAAIVNAISPALTRLLAAV